MLSKEFLNPGTMWTSFAGCLMLNGNVFISSAGYKFPPAARNTRSDFLPVGTNGSGCISYVPLVDTSAGTSQLDVAPASAMAVGTVPLSTCCLRVCSDLHAVVAAFGDGPLFHRGGQGIGGVLASGLGDGSGG